MKSLCIHAHFYQPPREDPFTGDVPREPGAEPYHDWNERITAECYEPNVRLGNLERISFNVGPTLAAWLEKHAPPTYQGFLAADAKNVAERGAGNALAQAYNHVILPLVPRRDKVTQVAWGIADFVHRFGRRPEGMWLPETAVDLETLDVLAEQGIAFTVLAPWQAENPAIDMTEPYLVRTSGGRTISVFFFDAQLGKHVSFNPRVTRDAREFAEVILPMRSSWYKEQIGQDELILIATDGEFYGHHQKWRDLFLRELLVTAAPRQGYEVTTLAAYLRRRPATREARIAERTAWSCYHSLERWAGTCPCIPADGAWKKQLQAALAWLGEQVDRAYLESSAPIADPWALRNDYVRLKLGEVDLAGLLDRHQERPLATKERARLGKLLESEYYRQWMHTSCGFFFDDLSRIEPRNNLAYAAKAIRLAGEATGGRLEAEFVERIRPARSGQTGRSAAEYYAALNGAGRGA